MTAILTPTAAAPLRSLGMSLDFFYRLSVDQYHAMIRFGILTEEDPVELLEGCLVLKMGINPKHWFATGQLRDVLNRLGLLHAFVHSQEPITTDESEPEPDVAIVHGERSDYFDVNPGPKDVNLIAEVSDSTLPYDRSVKKRIYARAGIPVYWIVNLIDRQVEVYTQPSGPANNPDYANCQIVGLDGELPVDIDGREVGRVKVKDVLP
jgi:Uma2 family endonuclease